MSGFLFVVGLFHPVAKPSGTNVERYWWGCELHSPIALGSGAKSLLLGPKTIICATDNFTAKMPCQFGKAFPAGRIGYTCCGSVMEKRLTWGGFPPWLIQEFGQERK